MREWNDATALMRQFTDRTGVTSHREPHRYLWTDAFAVCNLLGLARATGDDRHTETALRLVDQVHRVLGRYGAKDHRSGWISGASAAEGEAHPTRGGLRIGKPQAERGPEEPFDDRREWDRDGQYFHYLTKWMHALDQVTRSTGDARFNLWARELAASAYAAFSYVDERSGRRRMYWKISIDQSRPLVSSMGQHDPLDGYVTYVQLHATALAMGRSDGPDLADATAEFARMFADTELATGDPLGIGGLLADAYRVEQLADQGAAFERHRLPEPLLIAAGTGLHHWLQRAELDAPTTQRLAFRELGLAIGLSAVEAMARPEARRPARTDRSASLVRTLSHVLPLRAKLVAFWREADHDEPSWKDHGDINEVMLATALAPEGFLELPPPPERHARTVRKGTGVS